MSDTAMPTLQGMAGALRITPGAPPPLGLHSSRRDWASRIGHGVPATSLPGLMASLFNLCGHAHRLCSQLAIGAAAPGVLPVPTDAAERLRRETALEHLRRIGLDWPRLLATDPDFQGTASAAGASLRGCPQPVQDVPDPWPALREWLQDALLQMPVADWLSAWRSGGADWLLAWSQRTTGWLPALLRSARAHDSGTALVAAAALQPHRDAAELRQLGATLAHTPAFSLRPQWNGACAHTGPWIRLQDGARERSGPQSLTPWGLLGARLAELCQLAQDGGDSVLACGALATGPHRGLAWVEMARGLLLHQVEVHPVTQRVLACRVLAPTEWNFHPLGVVAQQLAALNAELPAPLIAQRVHLLVAAFDPCVPFDITHLGGTRSNGREGEHA